MLRVTVAIPEPVWVTEKDKLSGIPPTLSMSSKTELTFIIVSAASSWTVTSEIGFATVGQSLTGVIWIVTVTVFPGSVPSNVLYVNESVVVSEPLCT